MSYHSFVFFGTTIKADSASGQKVLSVASTQGYSVGMTITVNYAGARVETGVIASIQTGVSLTLVANLTYTHTAAQADVVEMVKDLFTDYGVTVKSMQGAGVPTPKNITLPYALGDGSLYQRTIYGERMITLICIAPHKSLAAIHSVRKKMIANISRDFLNSGTFILRYTGAGGSAGVDIPVRYAGGLELNDNDGLLNSPFPIQMLAVNPFWMSNAANTVSMATSGTISNGTWLIQATAGLWTGANASPNNVAEAPTAVVSTASGITYIGTAAALYVRAAAGTFTKYATTGGGILCLALGVDGATVYIGGSFTNLGGAGIGKLVKLAGTTFSNPASNTISSSVYGISAGPNYLWASVDDSTSGKSLYRCAYGGAWVTSLTNNATKNGRVATGYTGNEDTLIYFVATPNAGGDLHVYRYNTLFADLSDYGVLSAGGTINTIHSYYGGTCIGGSFTTINGVSASNIAFHLGSWTSLSSGLNNTVNSVFVLSVYGDVYAAGAFTDSGYSYFAKYSSGVWSSGGISTPQANTALWYVPSSDVVSLGFAAPGTPPVGGGSAGATTISNASDHVGYPVITITATGATTLQSIVNTYTGDSLLFNYAMSSGEVITIDCTPSVWSITSSYAGNILGALLAGSKLSSFGVSPGSQVYTAQFTDGTKATMTLKYYYTYLSVDSVAA